MYDNDESMAAYLGMELQHSLVWFGLVSEPQGRESTSVEVMLLKTWNDDSGERLRAKTQGCRLKVKTQREYSGSRRRVKTHDVDS